MFTIIPECVQRALDHQGVTVFSAQLYLSKQGPSLKLGGEYNWRRKGTSSLTPTASKQLMKKISEELSKQRYRFKMKRFRFEGKVYSDEFRIKILLQEGDMSSDMFESLVASINSRETVSKAFNCPRDSS